MLDTLSFSTTKALENVRRSLHSLKIRGLGGTISHIKRRLEQGQANSTASNFAPKSHAIGNGSILIVDAIVPDPANDSGSVRMSSVLSLLNDLGYQVALLPDQGISDQKAAIAIQKKGVQLLNHKKARSIVKLFREDGHRFSTIILSRYSIAARYFPLVKKYCPNARIIFDTVDLHFLRDQRQAAVQQDKSLVKKATRIKSKELELIKKCHTTLVVSPYEQDLVNEELNGCDVRILSNIHAVELHEKNFDERQGILFIGNYAHPPNVDAILYFAQDIFPRVLSQLPDMELHIVGSNINEAISNMASDNVIVHGFVEDIAPLFHTVRMSLAPLRYGAGVKGKVNTSMAYGVPVVATTVAVEGMSLTDGENILVADSDELFAHQIMRLYQDEALWLKLSGNGEQNIEAHFSKENARDALENLLKDLKSL